MSTLDKIIDRISRDLPTGYTLEIQVENGGVSVTLLDSDCGEFGCGPVDSDESIAECVTRLIQSASTEGA